MRSRGAYFVQSLRCRLLPNFDAVFSVFFTRVALSDARYLVRISLLGGATIFAKLRSKIAKNPKIGGKGFAHHFV